MANIPLSSDSTTVAPAPLRSSRKPPIFMTMWVQVLFAIAIAVVLGHYSPSRAIAMKPLGDAFIRLITMVITLIIFFTVVSGIAGQHNLRKVGRVGGKALIYFEVASTLALVIGLFVGNLVKPGKGLNVNPSGLDVKVVTDYAGQAKAQSVTEFLMHIIPTTVLDAFAKGDILEVLLVAVLFGLALSTIGPRCKPLVDLFGMLSQMTFGVVNIIMRFAPIGAFGAMAFTVGKYGIASLGPLAKLIGTFYLTSILFVLIGLGSVSWVVGLNIFKFLLYIKEEIVLVLGTSSSDTAMPSLMEKMANLGCSTQLVGLVVPMGYVFNTDGTGIYMTMAALFVAQATNTPLTFTQQLTIVAVAVLTSKGASGVQGASFIALVGTLLVVPSIPVGGMALILGIDRFMSGARALVNMIGNGVATIVLARWEGELDREALNASKLF